MSDVVIRGRHDLYEFVSGLGEVSYICSECGAVASDVGDNGRCVACDGVVREVVPDGGVSSERFQKRPDHCPLCGEEKNGLDFHHWDYGDDTGCYLCEPCHIAVHGGTEWWNAHDRRGRSQTWKVDAVENLVREHVQAHPDETTVREIVERYNIPDDEARELGVLVELALQDADGGAST